MRIQQGVGVGPQLQFSQPQGHLVGAEGAAAGQLHVQQPVGQVFRLRPVPEQQELLLWLLAQDTVLHAKLIVGQFDLLYAGQAQCLKVGTKLAPRVVPEHDALLVKQIAQRLLDLGIAHFSIPSSSAAMASGGGSCPARFCGSVLVIW